MTLRAASLTPVAGTLLLAACQSGPAADSGFLTSYEGLASPGGDPRAVIRQRRDDTASDAVERVFIQPAVLGEGAGEGLSDGERASVLREVDRQICFEVSERFDLADQMDERTALIRTAVVRIRPTGRVGSAVSAAANFFNPVPILNVRTPGTTGGLSVESEMLAPDGRTQIAAVTWGRDAAVVGMDSPSLSRVGDALQFAEPMGDAVGDAFASEAREVRDIPEPDPCLQYGPRSNFARQAGGAVVGIVTGLYVPEVERPADPD